MEKLSEAFEKMAELSEIKGEVRFKVKAYNRAAELVRSLGEEILKKDSVKELRQYPGIGEGVAKKILQFKETGTITRLEELQEEVPLELLSLLKVPNLGPKRAKLVYDELGVRTIQDLQEAAESNQLAQLKGLGPKAESNILEGIRHLQSTSGRILISQAYSLEKEITSLLRERIHGLIVNPAGSLRRMKETVGDLDLLVETEKSGDVMEAFCSLPMVEKVLLTGDTKSSVRTDDGLQVDLRVVQPGEYGAALQYFTGSKSHNVRVREIAKRKGLKINEYGVFEVEGNRRIAGSTEEEVYEAMGMALPPPELRENRGEVEAALEDRLPDLVEPGDIQGDLHAHTNASDGICSLEEMREAAEALGYGYLAITDHARGLKVAGGLDVDALRRQVERIRELNDRGDSGVVLMTGSELNIDNQGGLDFDDDILGLLDINIASIHGGFRQSRERITERIMKAIDNPHVKVLAHPTGRLIGQRPAYEVDLRAVMKEAAGTGTALELNAFPDRLDLNDEHLIEARQLGARIAIGTDAHRREHLGFMFYGVATARRGWLEGKNVLNVMEAEELLGWLWEGR
ncbi:MAG: DNA polymerase/3'-5' exonuclease PolX [Actinomycetota bacterium]|nr:DNA polymerase/3'-5' exonuclease PolX [Actinomycetota bacterium]